MGSESETWKALKPLLSGLDPVRVENPACPGTPDVNYTHGWIELKFAERWPPRGGPLRVDHFTQKQRIWLTQRRKADGLAFILLKVGVHEWLLFDGAMAAKVLGHVPQHILYKTALVHWKRKPKREELQEWLLPN